MLTITKLGEYVNKSRNIVFRFEVKSNLVDTKAAAAEIAQYKKVRGDFYREDTVSKAPLFFDSRNHPNGTEIVTNFDKSNYRVNQDLAAQSERIDAISITRQGELTGTAAYLGLTKAQMGERMIAAMAGK